MSLGPKGTVRKARSDGGLCLFVGLALKLDSIRIVDVLLNADDLSEALERPQKAKAR
jgi:hypothetical protein